jgi:RimJ/RimL family protein N-acetyltransferase
VHYVSDSARNHGARGIYWKTQSDNEVAKRLYDKIGERSPYVLYARSVA